MSEHRNGPVRSAAARDSILDATARLLALQGYDNLTMEGIAKEAGVGKQTIYRWWRSRGALIADCMIEGRLATVEIDLPDTGDLGGDLNVWLEGIVSIVADPAGGALLRSLVAAAAEDGAVGDRLAAALGADQTLSLRLASAVRAGQLPEGAPVDQLGLAILGAIIVPVLARRPIDAVEIRRLVDHLIRPAG
ncbi:MAG: TetR/AcrR family transcriptional regulator [Microbacterium sp.]|uniref:TetR/AcrR family transcriptional regulator n=1 Tax=Microbacterium sp. TaxID=51671 RepID=UPI001DB8D597|nr:TetR/AcrR family transcriptional regulator [Microbacterium sp.]MBW8762624.1 TetR/AcrR family transcriptional regulator [Microbacterium sp.]